MEVDLKLDSVAQTRSGISTIEENEPQFEQRECILSFLCNCDDIHFRSQQIDEPELSVLEKRSILEEVLNRNRSTFLFRFGHHLLHEHLSYFNTSDDRKSYEVQFYLSQLKKKKTAAFDVVVKNRRFQAMKKLMSESEYFTVGEMRKRNPLLFDQLLGNFVKNPRVQFDCYQQYQLAHILLDQLDQDKVAALQKLQLQAEKEQREDDSSSDDTPEDDEGYSTKDTTCSVVSDIDVVDQAPWGSTYKNNHVIGRTRWKNKHNGQKCNVNAKVDLSQEEKSLLINEFTSFMFNSFLQGKDEFDYSKVDYNPEYDDMNQREIDEQEKYFESESPEEIESCYNVQTEIDQELDQLYQDLTQGIKSEKLANQLKHMNTQEKPLSSASK